jgi:hypothetical protein
VNKWVDNISLLDEENLITSSQFIERTEAVEIGRKKEDESFRDNPR